MDRIVFLLAFITALSPISTDMYLPAVPELQRIWNQPLVIINLTLVAFFATYCLFLLVYGPLSDRFGRKRPLLVSLSLYIVASLLCALSPGIKWLIAARILQGAGAAAGNALTLAITKDLYEGIQQEKVFAYLGVIIGIAPMLAPTLGGLVLRWFTWEWIFIFQACCGVIAMIGIARMSETLREPSRTGVRELIGKYAILLRNRRYLFLTLAVALMSFSMFSFIAGSASMYIAGFGVNETTYGYFFAFNGTALILAPLLLTRFAGTFSATQIMRFAALGILCAGAWMVVEWNTTPWRLALPMWCVSFCFSLSRPISNHLILAQVDRDTGTASSLMIFLYFLTGSMAIWLISLDWKNPIAVMGIMNVIVGGMALIFWIAWTKLVGKR
ncbi:multidrug effflux MFS transporter [Desulfoplanes sp. PS50]